MFNFDNNRFENIPSNRLKIILIIWGACFFVIVLRLAQLQLISRESHLSSINTYLTDRSADRPKRGSIFDRNGHPLAVSGNDWEVGLDLIPLSMTREERIREMVDQFAPILGLNSAETTEEILASRKNGLAYYQLSNRLDFELGLELLALEISTLQIRPIQRRLYGENKLACYVLGYVNNDGEGQGGVEGYYDENLVGVPKMTNYPNAPHIITTISHAQNGEDLILTLDRMVQYVAEKKIKETVEKYGASRGQIIVANPRTGELLAMASSECYDPYNFANTPIDQLSQNPFSSGLYEPGSVMKLITMSAALDSGTVRPETRYLDDRIIVAGGIPISNADGLWYGDIDMAHVLVYSVNTATTWLAQSMGLETFYGYLERFNFGNRTEIDLMGEEEGTVKTPYSGSWSESDFASNSFGQAINITPIQLVSAVSAIANGGVQMRPHLLKATRLNGIETTPQLDILGRPITAETARLVTEMAVLTAENYKLDVPGYTIAGKTGTAQISFEPGSALGYRTDAVVGSFIGWLPAYDPQLLILVKLDELPGDLWGSTTAAPAFAELVKELVVVLDIPPDKMVLATP